METELFVKSKLGGDGASQEHLSFFQMETDEGVTKINKFTLVRS